MIVTVKNLQWTCLSLDNLIWRDPFSMVSIIHNFNQSIIPNQSTISHSNSIASRTINTYIFLPTRHRTVNDKPHIVINACCGHSKLGYLWLDNWGITWLQGLAMRPIKPKVHMATWHPYPTYCFMVISPLVGPMSYNTRKRTTIGG